LFGKSREICERCGLWRHSTFQVISLYKGTNTFIMFYYTIFCINFSFDRNGKIFLDFGTEKVVSNTILVWGAISSSYPKASLCRVNGKFDSSSYKDILQKYVIPLTKEPSKPIGLVHDW